MSSAFYVKKRAIAGSLQGGSSQLVNFDMSGPALAIIGEDGKPPIFGLMSVVQPGPRASTRSA